MIYNGEMTIDEPLVNRTGRVVIGAATQRAGLTATDLVVEELRREGFPMPFSLSDSTPRMAETVNEWHHRVKMALKQCGAQRLVVRNHASGAVELAWH